MDDRIRDALGAVHAEEALKQKTKAYLADRKEPVRCAPRGRRLAAAFACFLLVFIGLSGYLWFTPVSAVSIEAETSVELGVNRFDRVVTVEGCDGSGVRYKLYTEAIEALLSYGELEQYVNSGSPVSIAVIGDTEEKSEEMLSSVEKCGVTDSANVSCASGNHDEAAAASEAGLTYGKYLAFLELRQLDPTVTEEDVQGLTMHQIRDMIEELTEHDSGEDGEPEVSHQGSGGGSGSGNGSGHGGGEGTGQQQGWKNGKQDR